MGIKRGPMMTTSKGMNIKNQGGMNINSSKQGMGLSDQKNYFSFNEYERKKQ
jgi:hypothetical protein